MSRQHHYIKIKPEYYRAIERGDKTFEVRYNDRDYQAYDVLHLQEWCGNGEFSGGEYTGREIIADVTYVFDNPEFCKEGFVIMGIRVVSINN